MHYKNFLDFCEKSKHDDLGYLNTIIRAIVFMDIKLKKNKN